jgi:hypothetical protein
MKGVKLKSEKEWVKMKKKRGNEHRCVKMVNLMWRGRGRGRGVIRHSGFYRRLLECLDFSTKFKQIMPQFALFHGPIQSVLGRVVVGADQCRLAGAEHCWLSGGRGRPVQHTAHYGSRAPVTSEVVGSIPGQTHSSCDRGRLSWTA